MAKKVESFIKLQIEAGKANPSPPIGPALGQHGVNIMEFCKAFNAKTQESAGSIIPVVITVYFITKTPPVPSLIMSAIGVKKGSGEPNKDSVGTISLSQVEEIAKTKLPDLNTNKLDSAINMIKGTARSMGVKVGV